MSLQTLHTIRRETRMLADDPGVYPAHQSDDATIVTVDTSVTSTRAIQAQSPPHHSSSRVTSRRPSSRSSAKRRKQRKGPSSVSPSPDRADSKPKGEKSGQFAKILIHKMDSSGVASKAPSEDKNPPPRRSNSASSRPYFTSHPSASSTARDKESVRASVSARHTPLTPASPPSVASVASGSTYRIATPDVPLSLLPTKLAKTARDSPQRPAWVFVPDKGPYNLPQAFTGESMVVSHVSTPASTAACEGHA